MNRSNASSFFACSLLGVVRRLIFLLLIVTPPTLTMADSPSLYSRELWKKGVRYELGQGVRRDYKRAYRYYCYAAKLGHPSAFFSIGWLFMAGKGLKRDLAVALGWFEQAAALGDAQAVRILKKYGSIQPKYDSRCSFRKTNITKIQITNWVRSIAPQFMVDPELVLAVINAESAFDPNALSAKNARGLMQLIPATAKRFGVRNVWNPVENIKGGSAYLNWLLRRFKGNVRLTLAAYNAGENTIQKYQGIPPYKETQNYVRKIIATYGKTRHPIPPPVRE
ncbi:MAG: transglycosylase SLT domain-containing protein [Methylohalobius sp. ZOD2]